MATALKIRANTTRVLVIVGIIFQCSALDEGKIEAQTTEYEDKS